MQVKGGMYLPSLKYIFKLNIIMNLHILAMHQLLCLFNQDLSATDSADVKGLERKREVGRRK